MGGWFMPDPDDSSERGGSVWVPNKNPDGDSKKGGCDMAIPRVIWTILKVSFNYIFRGIKPDYVT